MRLLFVSLLMLSVTVEAAPQWLPDWRQTSAMQTARAGAAVVHAGDYVYLLGGIDGRHFLRSVEVSRLYADGHLGPWKNAAPLTEPRGFFSALAYRGWIYVFGGGNGPHGHNLLATIERARILADGRLSRWQSLPLTMTQPRRCVKVVRLGQRFYALGGFNSRLLDSVESAQVFADGRLSAWRKESGHLTIPRYINAAKVVAERLYVIGGHNDREGTGLVNVEEAAAKHGKLGSWQPSQSLTRPRYALSAAAGGGWLYALGGLNGALYSDVVEVVAVTGNGLQGSWRETTPLSSARANFSTFVAGQRLYVLGGTNRDGYYDTVEYAKIGADGRLGIDATLAEQRQYKERLALAPIKPAVVPQANHGRVREVIQTSAYSYLAVEQDGHLRWLVAPKMTIKIGDDLGFSRGLEMHDFYSRTLDRRFDAILFVEQAVRLQAGRQDKNIRVFGE